MNNKNIGVLLGVVVIIGGLLFLGNTSQDRVGGDSNLISSNGVHWHPRMEIYIHGEKQEIPQGIGLVGGHNPMHTHDASGEIHLEYPARVTEDDTRISNFFNIWREVFNSEQILDAKNGEEGQVRMFVNGEENFEFEQYMMRDGDEIEIRFE